MTTIDRHGAAIDADLHSEFHGLCLLEWFRGEHSWNHLFRLLGQLGTDSRWYKAQLNDPELAEQWAQQQLEREEKGETREWRPSLADFTQSDQLTLMLVNEIRGLRYQMSDQKRKPEPAKGPETAMDVALTELRRQREEDYFERLLSVVEEGQQRWRQQQNPEMN